VDQVETRSGVGTASRTLAFLFTDIAGSTSLWEEQPEAMATALARHDAILQQAVTDAGGQVVKTTGDGIMAAFPSATDAARAAIVGQVALAAEPWVVTPLRVRMGIHAGESERRDGDFFGPTVNRAARIMAAGHGGQVLLSSAAASLAVDRLPDDVSLRDLGEYRLKDLGRPERVFQLVHPGLDPSFPPLVSLDHGAGGLPAETATFVGRRTERTEIAGLLAEDGVRLLTLSGPGGTGKTSLAIRVAGDVEARYPDGVSFVDLAAADDPESVLIAIGRALGVGEARDRSLHQTLVERLTDRHMLLVLDNFEQVTEAAEVVVALLAECPGLDVLVTSREPLRMRAERVYPVVPLDLPPATRGRLTADALQAYGSVQLFVERARAVRPDFELTDENAQPIADICRRLDGLPLAIELAAGRLRLFSPEGLRDRLTSRLELLRSSERDRPARHQTLRATIDWSYQLLDRGERDLFEVLGAFADADVDGLESVARAIGITDVDMVDALASLLEKNLVRQHDTSAADPRFAMLETVREFSAERLDAGGRGPQVRRAHAVHHTDLATQLRRDLDGPDRDRAMQRLVAESPNLRVALHFWVEAGEVDELVRLADSLLSLNEARGWYHDTVVLTTSLLTVLANTSRPELAGREIGLRMRLARAILASEGFTPEAERAFASALERFEGGRDLGQHYSVLRGLANLYVMRTEFAKALEIGERILAIAEAEGDAAIRIDGRLVVGSTMAFTGEVEAGLRHLDAAIDEFDTSPAGRIGGKVGNDPRVACLTTSGFLLWLMGRPDSAVLRANRALELAGGLDHAYTSAYALFHSGLLHLWRREPDVVLERAIALAEIADAYDLRIWSAIGACLMGAGQSGVGQFDRGLASIDEGLAAYQGMISPPIFWPLLLFLKAGASGVAGRPELGLPPIDEGIALLGGPDSRAMLLPELELLRGDLLMAADRSAETGVAAYRSALQGARRIGVPMSELRALTRLTTSGEERDRSLFADELRASLATFTEGFETADLRDAGAALRSAGEVHDRAPRGP
jgi:predicted ATPase/class 3 adenylate cyclase